MSAEGGVGCALPEISSVRLARHSAEVGRCFHSHERKKAAAGRVSKTDYSLTKGLLIVLRLHLLLLLLLRLLVPAAAELR